MKNEKAKGTSGVVVGMLKTASDICYKIIKDLINTIILEGKVPADSSDCIMFSLFKGKGDALDQSNYHGLIMF